MLEIPNLSIRLIDSTRRLQLVRDKILQLEPNLQLLVSLIMELLLAEKEYNELTSLAKQIAEQIAKEASPERKEAERKNIEDLEIARLERQSKKDLEDKAKAKSLGELEAKALALTEFMKRRAQN